ncbi:MAG: aminodeoxychorismate lyase, protein [Candidatus Paceibacter sp.]|jgi:UPF0755 protein|nr:aminodeoxychorismate lyase, protein [Candidatus Paceibacter sp.]
MPSFISKLFKSLTFAVCVGIGFVAYFYFFQFRAPKDFPQSTVVAIGNGKSLSEIGYELEKQRIIRSEFWFVNFVILLKHEKQIVGGEYYFERPMNVFEIAKQVTAGNFGVEQLKTTIPEGSTVFDISDIVHKNYPNFDTSKFILQALPQEGYLFPDTYKFGTHVTPEIVISTMNSTFNKKIADPDLKIAIERSGRKLRDILIMASILEGEARQMRTRQIIAGILWERLRLGMPLQVDAAFRYVNGKTTEELTLDDLKIDSPYNTYLYKGLPPGPISNPGMDSILATVTPIETEYLFFLTDDNGTMHYAETFEEHSENVEKYLR